MDTSSKTSRHTRWTSIVAVIALVAVSAGCSSGNCFDVGQIDIPNPFPTDCAPPAPQPVCEPPPVVTPPPACDPAPVPYVPATPVAQAPARPDANPGEVYCYVKVPPVTRTITEKVCVREATCKQVWVEPEVREIEERVCTRQPETRMRCIPARFEEVPESICVADARVEWQKVGCNPNKLQAGEEVGECWQLVEIPAQYETRTKRVCVQQEQQVPEEIPGQYEMRKRLVTVKEGYYRTETIPAVHEDRSRVVEVAPARWEWRRTSECEVPTAAIASNPAPAASTPYDPSLMDPVNTAPAAPTPVNTGFAPSPTGVDPIPPAGNLPPASGSYYQQPGSGR